MERLQKVLAARGVASRRKAEELILAGRVQVNGKTVKELGVRVASTDRITVDGEEIGEQPLTYLILNKPPGYVTTAHDPQGRPTVLDLVPKDVRLYPVGRLDYDTSGILLLTNDGELANILTHPRFGVKKTYRALVQGQPTESALDKLRRSVHLADGLTQPAEARVIERKKEKTILELTIAEGRKRQVRRMCEAVGQKVLKLERISFGSLRLGNLPLAATRPLTSREKEALEKIRFEGRKKQQLEGHTMGRGGRKDDHSQKRG